MVRITRGLTPAIKPIGVKAHGFWFMALACGFGLSKGSSASSLGRVGAPRLNFGGVVT